MSTSNAPSPPQRGGDAARQGSFSQRLLSKFSRVTSGGAFIPEIDGLRFFAIITVVFHHLATQVERQVLRGPYAVEEGGSGWLLGIAHYGGVGVQVFFAISGFILAMPFAKAALTGGRPVALKEYFWRRLTRLEPPFILCMVVLYVAWTVIVPAVGVVIEDPPRAANLGYSLIYGHYLRYGELSKVNGVTWSLEIEVQFYILMPLIANVFRIQHKVIRRGVLLAAMACTVLIKGLFDAELQKVHLSLSLVGYLHCFLVGLLLADVYLTDWKSRPTKGLLGWDCAGIAAAVGVLWFGGGGSLHPGAIALFLLCNFVLFVAAFRGRAVQMFFSNRWVATIGGMCYSIYLWHYAVLFATILLAVKVMTKLSGRFGDDWFIVGGGSPTANLLLWAVISLPVVLAVSAFFFVLIERPCMRKDWPQRLMARAGLRKVDTDPIRK
jgi:peptidoglycan/LPS O-acetylase OafA/YrhL